MYNKLKQIDEMIECPICVEEGTNDFECSHTGRDYIDWIKQKEYEEALEDHEAKLYYESEKIKDSEMPF